MKITKTSYITSPSVDCRLVLEEVDGFTRMMWEGKAVDLDTKTLTAYRNLFDECLSGKGEQHVK